MHRPGTTFNETRDEGFTLIELMVVVLIIAILLAIAIPTFLSARDTANSRAAESDLRIALLTEQMYYTNHQSFSADPSAMSLEESSINWVTSDAGFGNRRPNQVIIADMTNSVTNDSVGMATFGSDSKCYNELEVNETTASVPAATYFQIYKPTAGGSCATPATMPSTSPTPGSAADHVGTALGSTWYTGW